MRSSCICLQSPREYVRWADIAFTPRGCILYLWCRMKGAGRGSPSVVRGPQEAHLRQTVRPGLNCNRSYGIACRWHIRLLRAYVLERTCSQKGAAAEGRNSLSNSQILGSGQVLFLSSNLY
jgi:hypothetical protein